MPPSDFLLAVADRLPPGDVLDVACGGGRNLAFFLARGDRVVGIDRERARLLEARAAAPAGSSLDLVQADLERVVLPRRRFDVVVNVRYLQRSLAPALAAALRPGGVLLFETFLAEQLGRGHPRNPEFVLQHGELPRLFPRLQVLRYEEGFFADGERAAYLARLLARQP